MQLIKPSQISGEIMTLIEEADEKLILVSPYCNFSKWKKLKRAINFAQKKNIEIEFYIRKGESKTYQSVKQEGFNPIEIENLHTKLYLNESYAIITSMNLLEYSDMNSLDIGYKTETQTEYEEIIDYYNRYLASNVTKSLEIRKIEPNIKEIELKNHHEWFEFINQTLLDKLKRSFYCKFDGTKLKIQGSNLYYAHISQNRGKNFLNINGILSQAEKNKLDRQNREFENKYGIEIATYNYDQTGGYNQIWHHSKKELKSISVDFMNTKEFLLTSKIITDFIVALEDFKMNF